MPSKMKASVALILAFIISRWHRHVSSVLVAFLLIAATPISAFAKGPEGWKVFTDSDEKIQFLSIGLPKKQQVNNPDITRIIWHFGFLEDGTNGYVDAMRLNKGSLAGFDVVKQSKNLRNGLESKGKLRITAENRVKIAGYPAIEFQTTSVTSTGSTWHGIVRMVVIDNAMYTLSIAVPNSSRLQDRQVNEFLSSLKKN